MIRINLLPSDLRRGNRIPPKVLAVAFAAAEANSCCGRGVRSWNAGTNISTIAEE